MAIQLYGQFGGHGSFDQVSRALAWALRRVRANVTLFGIGTLDVRYTDVPYSVAHNARAAVGICVGYPPAAESWLIGHKHRVLVTVCETSPVPDDWVRVCNEMSLVCVPSGWCKEVFEESGVRVPIMIVRHGVPDWWAWTIRGQAQNDDRAANASRPPDDHRTESAGLPSSGIRILDAGPPRRDTLSTNADHGPRDTRSTSVIRLLHVSDAASFPERKGTPQLLLAFRRIAERYPNVELTVKSRGLHGIENLQAKLGLPVRAERRIIPDREMPGFLAGFDAVVQPSRAEGFGLVPLEARCLGVPVLLSPIGGHYEHLARGADVVIEPGPTTDLATQGSDVGRAPSVTVRAVEDGLVDLLDGLEVYRTATRLWAVENLNRWTQSAVLRAWAVRMARLDRSDEEGRVGLNEEAGLRGVRQ